MDSSGRPSELFAPNGSTFQIAYLSPTLLSVDATSADGTLHVNVGVDISAAPGTAQAMTVRPLARRPLTPEPASLPASWYGRAQ